MSQALIDDDLWTRIAPLLPKRRPRNRQHAGRKPIPDRAVLTGILFVLRSGIPWKMLPKEMGCGSGSTCWRRLVRWQRAGVWKRLHRVLLTELRRRARPEHDLVERHVRDEAFELRVFVAQLLQLPSLTRQHRPVRLFPAATPTKRAFPPM